MASGLQACRNSGKQRLILGQPRLRTLDAASSSARCRS